MPVATAPRVLAPRVVLPSVPSVVYVTWSPSAGSAIVVRTLGARTTTTLLGPTTADCFTQPSLSPDATQLLYLVYPGQCRTTGTVLPQPVLLTLATGVRVDLLPHPVANSFYDEPTWCPAYPSWPTGTPTTTETAQCPEGPVLVTLEQLSSTGTYLWSNLLALDGAAGSGAVGKLVNNAFDGAYSPVVNGTVQAVYRPTAKGAADDLVLTDATLTASATLLYTDVAGVQPAGAITWNATGTAIAYMDYVSISPTDTQTGLAVLSMASPGTNSPSALGAASAGGLWDDTPSWSADGTELYFDAFPASGGVSLGYNALYSVDSQGARRAPVASSTGTALYEAQAFGPSPATALPAPASYVPLAAPYRVLSGYVLSPGAQTDDVAIAGATGTGVPAGAVAVTLSVTGVNQTGGGTYLAVYPAPAPGVAPPGVSTLNLGPHQIAAVADQVTLPTTGSTAGQVQVLNALGSTKVDLDITGYYLAGAPSTTTAGLQLLPSTTPPRALGLTTVAAGQECPATVTTLAGAPAAPVAVLVSLTAVLPTAGTYLSAVPSTASTPQTGCSAVSAPGTSTLNLSGGGQDSNLAVVPVGPSGQIDIYNAVGSVQVVVDVEGYFVNGAGSAYHPDAIPARVLDTRNGTDTVGGSTATLSGASTLDLPLVRTLTTAGGQSFVPSTAVAVAVTLTVVAPTAATFITAYPEPASAGAPPIISQLTTTRGAITPSLAVIPLGRGGVRLFNAAGRTPLIADITGYYGS